MMADFPSHKERLEEIHGEGTRRREREANEGEEKGGERGGERRKEGRGEGSGEKRGEEKGERYVNFTHQSWRNLRHTISTNITYKRHTKGLSLFLLLMVCLLSPLMTFTWQLKCRKENGRK